MMKNRVFFLLLLAMFSSVSCKKFLDTKPLDFIDVDSYYHTEEHLKSAIAGVYDLLGKVYGNYYLYRYGMDAEEGRWGNNYALYPESNNYDAGDYYIKEYWQNLYSGISRANILLENVDKNLAIEERTRRYIRGEALFLRSYFYFLLVQTYGGVPLILTPMSSVRDVNIPRSSAKEVYDQVIADMTEAEDLVLGIREIGFGGRVSKSAVRGILARVCLNMAGYPLNDQSKYALAKKWCEKVINDTEANHSLNPSFSQVFMNYSKDAYDVKESIWEVEYYGTPGTFNETGYVGANNGPINTINANNGLSIGGLRASAILYKRYLPGDLRRDWSIANFKYLDQGEKGAKTFYTASTEASIYASSTLRYAGKFRREYSLNLPSSIYMTEINYPLLRFSDIYLMYAEASFGVDGTIAENEVNLVRRRAWSTGIKTITILGGGTGYTSAPTVTITGGGGAGAIAVATIKSGKVDKIEFPIDEVIGVKNGNGYTSAPTITISGGGGTGATASATIYTVGDAEISATDKANFKDFILEERSREFCYEGMRRFDLIRSGNYVDLMHHYGAEIVRVVPAAVNNYALKYLNVNQKHLLWPIPAYEMGLNRALTQNPNW